MYALCGELYPICRSITGEGLRATLRAIQQIIPIQIQEVPSGTQVFDWEIPQEWNISDAYIKNAAGVRVVDFNKSNLHVLNYSEPIHENVSRERLLSHIHTIPEQPDLIPYRTSYYQRTWGFCMSHQMLQCLNEENYEVCIDATLTEGSLSYGELFLAGESDEEVLLSAHACHPSLANDNLSGIAVLVQLARLLANQRRRYSYRFIFAPGTIGSIAWLQRNEQALNRIKHGLVLACLGDGGGPSYKKSRQGDAFVDRAVGHVLRHSFPDANIEDFSPYGYDERQYCSPGIDLPVGLFQRSKHGQFSQYHTSADNLDFIEPQHLEGSLQTLITILDVLERDRCYLNTNPKCEPQLGKRGLYDAIGADKDRAGKQMALLWILNLSDGNNTLLDIAERSGISFSIVADSAQLLADANLLIAADGRS